MIISIYPKVLALTEHWSILYLKNLSLISNICNICNICPDFAFDGNTHKLEIGQSEVSLKKFNSKTYCSILNHKEMIDQSKAYKLCFSASN